MLFRSPNIEGCYVDPGTSRLILYGFNSKYFVVYDESRHIELMRVDCGGAHRLWAFHPARNGATKFPGSFAWTQASQFMWVFGRTMETKLIKEAGHGREIKASSICPISTCSGKTLLATGAEDTEIRLFEYENKSPSKSLKCVRIIKQHNTGIQHLSWSKDGKYLFSSGGQEEFFIWKIQQVPIIGIGVVLLSALPHTGETSDLRITSFDTEFTAVTDERDAQLYPMIKVFMHFPTPQSGYTSTISITRHGIYFPQALTQPAVLLRPNSWLHPFLGPPQVNC